jgi:hypothetical protein
MTTDVLTVGRAYRLCQLPVGTADSSGHTTNIRFRNTTSENYSEGYGAVTDEERDERLDRIERLLSILVDRQQIKEFYPVDEFARLAGRTRFTVREWCRHHRINAEKRSCGRGAHSSWVISHDELLRFQKEGLLPEKRY